MATTYSVVYGAALGKMTEYEYSGMDTTDIDNCLYDYLISAIARFMRVCKTNLSDRDDMTKQFNSDLTIDEIDILSELMVEQWIKPKLNCSELMRNHLNTKDFTMHSSYNLLNSLRDSYNNIHSTTETMIKRYSYYNGNIKDIGNDDS